MSRNRINDGPERRSPAWGAALLKRIRPGFPNAERFVVPGRFIRRMNCSKRFMPRVPACVEDCHCSRLGRAGMAGTVSRPGRHFEAIQATGDRNTNERSHSLRITSMSKYVTSRVPACRERRRRRRLAGSADFSKRSNLRKYETPKSEASIKAGGSECATSGRTYLAIPAVPYRPCTTTLSGIRDHHADSLRVVSYSKSSWVCPLVRGSYVTNLPGVPKC
ncbi:hypothetical protein SCOR_23895 [Sulfidibacter corallicola]